MFFELDEEKFLYLNILIKVCCSGINGKTNRGGIKLIAHYHLFHDEFGLINQIVNIDGISSANIFLFILTRFHLKRYVIQLIDASDII